MKEDFLYLLVSNILNKNQHKTKSTYRIKLSKRTLTKKNTTLLKKKSKTNKKDKITKIFNKNKFYKSIEKKNFFKDNLELDYSTKKLTKERQKELTKIINKKGDDFILRKLSREKGFTKSDNLKKKIADDINWIKLKLLSKMK